MRPLCKCGRPAAFVTGKRRFSPVTGKQLYKSKCPTCEKEAAAARQGLSKAQYAASIHQYRKYLKDYCENKDGYLGYKCRVPKKMFTINGLNVLQVDHADGDPSNNDPSNLVTLCPTCHTIKTKQNSDHITPGRTKLGIIASARGV